MSSLTPTAISPYLKSHITKNATKSAKSPYSIFNVQNSKPDISQPLHKSKFAKAMDWLLTPVENVNQYQPQKQTRLKIIVDSILSIASLAFIGFISYKSYKKLGVIGQKNSVFGTKASELWQDLTNRPNMEDLALPEKLQNTAKRLIYKIQNPTEYLQKGGTDKKTILLYGPPGTGKTTFAQAICKHFENSRFVSIDLGEIEGKYVGESQQNLNNAVKRVCEFAKDNPDKKVFVFFDEIDSIAIQDNGSSNQQYHASVLNVLKKAISEKFSKFNNIITIAATNVDIDKGTKSQGFTQTLSNTIVDRFDEKIKVDNPTSSQLAIAISRHYANAPKAAECLKRADSAEVKQIAEELERKHVSFRVLENLYNTVASNDKPTVGFNDVIEAVKGITAIGVGDSLKRIGFNLNA